MNKENQKPNTFIIGGPKCGTTALSEYLKTHPDIYLSRPKEPHFFCSDLYQEPHYPSEEAYLEECFEGASGEPARIDATPHNLRSPTAVKRILEFNPDAKFIVMARNPVDMSYSRYQHLFYCGDEKHTDFYTAWKKQSDPKNTFPTPLLQYQEMGKLGEQIENLYNTVDPDRVLIITFPNFIRDTRAEYLRTLDFLDLADDHRTDFPSVNFAKQRKSRLLMKLRNYLVKKQKTIKKIFHIPDGLGILQALNRKNTVYEKMPALDPSFRKELEDFFREDVQKFKNITGIDLFESSKENK